MLLKQLMEAYELLDRPDASGEMVKEYLQSIQPRADVTTYVLEGRHGTTDMLKVVIPGKNGKRAGGTAPTIGLIGRLGGMGARPEAVGMVSDADGAWIVTAIAAKLLDMANKGDYLEGDVMISTHLCPNAPTSPHKPVAFMGSPVSTAQLNKEEVSDEMDAILTVDSTRANRYVNHRGFAITPTIKEGWILRISEDLLDIVQNATGEMPYVMPITTQDLTPYGNGTFHINSIIQPSTATKCPVVGVATTAAVPVAGCATGVNPIFDLEAAARFMIEVCIAFTKGVCSFYDPDEFDELQERYGTMSHLQTFGSKGPVDDR